jgi:hypothetical protein
MAVEYVGSAREEEIGNPWQDLELGFYLNGLVSSERFLRDAMSIIYVGLH